MMIKVCTWFLIFIIFSVLGWVAETLLYLIRDGKAVKRGFLFGPLCPIYGFAALICDLLIYGVLDNIFYIAAAGFLYTGVLEYVTHFLMEKIFHAMWWDYSDRKFNVHGRVYLKGLLFFAAGSVIIVKVLLPLIYALIDMMPVRALYITSFAVYTVFVADLATTFADLKDTIGVLKHIQRTAALEVQKGVDATSEQLEQIKQNTAEQLEELKDFITESETYRKAITENQTLIDFKRRHPTLMLLNFKYIMNMISDRPDNSKKRKDIKLYGTADSLPDDEEKVTGKEGSDDSARDDGKKGA